MSTKGTQPVFIYDVCLSFAGEDRAYVQQLADALRDQGIRVFYDEYEKARLWGKDLYAHLDEIYRRSARFCIVFISTHYATKLWTNHERQSAQARAFTENEEYLLPVRFDDTEVPGIRPTVGYVDLRSTSPSELTSLIIAKLNLLPRAAVFIDGDCLLPAPGEKPGRIRFERLLAKLRLAFGENASVSLHLGHAPRGHTRERLISQLQSLGYSVETNDDSRGFEMRLALRASELPPNVHTLVLVSCDRDLIPLLEQAKATRRTTILIGPPNLASESLKKAADRFVGLDEFLL